MTFGKSIAGSVAVGRGGVWEGGELCDENDLRKWLRSVLGPACAWVEPARGGTVGNADVYCPTALDVPGGWRCLVPVELKHWERRRHGGRRMVFFEVRPAQVRFHKMMRANRIKTAFLGLVEGEVFFLEATQVPLGYSEEAERRMVKVSKGGLQNCLNGLYPSHPSSHGGIE